MADIQSLSDQIIERTEMLKSKRLNFEKLWQEVSELVLPRKADFTVTQTQGASRTRRLFETTAVNAAELLAAGLHGMMTNPAGKWFSLTAANRDKSRDINPRLAQWLEDAERIMTEEISRPAAGFATNMHEVYLDLAVLGTAGIYVGWNEDRECLLFQSRFLGELFIDENAAGQVDSVFRVFRWPLEKMVKTWGEDALPDHLKSRYRHSGRNGDEFEIIHAVMPNPLYRRGTFQKPVTSVYVLKNERHVLFSGGFEEMPLFVSRWAKASSEVYGRSPAISALPDIKMLQEMMKETIIAAQLANRPPLLVKDDDQFAPVATVPGGIIRYSGEAPKAFVSGANSGVGLDIMNEIRQRIRMAFFNDQLMTESGVQMTATEVIQRTEEKMRLLGPVAGRLQTELLGPMIERVFGLLRRHGKIPPPPKSFMNGKSREVHVAVEYLSPLAMAQKQLEAQAMVRTLELANGFIGMDPEASAVFNVPEVIRRIGQIYGTGNNFLRSEEEIKELTRQKGGMDGNDA
mgnify:CR=1 FL=1